MKVENTIDIYEVNGASTAIGEKPELKVKSHWNSRYLVVIEIDGQRYGVDAEELRKAIQNAKND